MKENNMSKTNRSNQSIPIFQKYVQIAENLCDFLRENEKIKARALPEHQYEMVKNKFLSFPDNVQNAKIKNLENYYADCKDFASQGIPLSSKQDCLSAFMKKYKLSVPNEDEVFSQIDSNSFIEVYDNNFTQVFRSADFMNVTSHGFITLETCEWFDLFERSKDLTSDQVEVVQKILSGSIKNPMYKPIEDHHVKEINTDEPKTSLAEVVVYAPVHGADDSLHGILHIFRVQEQRSLNFKVIKGGKS